MFCFYRLEKQRITAYRFGMRSYLSLYYPFYSCEFWNKSQAMIGVQMAFAYVNLCNASVFWINNSLYQCIFVCLYICSFILVLMAVVAENVGKSKEKK